MTSTASSTAPEIAAAAPAPASPTAYVADCKEDLPCFIGAARECRLATAQHTGTISLGGVKESSRAFLEIKGPESGRCAFYIRTEKIDIDFPPDTPPQVANVQKAMLKLLEGRDGTCKLTTMELSDMLTRWSNDQFSTEDFKGKDCEGRYFSKDL